MSLQRNLARRKSNDSLLQYALDAPPALLDISLDPSSEHEVGIALDEHLTGRALRLGPSGQVEAAALTLRSYRVRRCKIMIPSADGWRERNQAGPRIDKGKKRELTDDDRRAVQVLCLVQPLVLGKGIHGHVCLSSGLEIRQTLLRGSSLGRETDAGGTHRSEQGHIDRVGMIEIEAVRESELDLLRRVLLVEAVLGEDDYGGYRSQRAHDLARDVRLSTGERFQDGGVDEGW